MHSRIIKTATIFQKGTNPASNFVILHRHDSRINTTFDAKPTTAVHRREEQEENINFIIKKKGHQIQSLNYVIAKEKFVSD